MEYGHAVVYTSPCSRYQAAPPVHFMISATDASIHAGTRERRSCVAYAATEVAFWPFQQFLDVHPS